MGSSKRLFFDLTSPLEYDAAVEAINGFLWVLRSYGKNLVQNWDLRQMPVDDAFEMLSLPYAVWAENCEIYADQHNLPDPAFNFVLDFTP